MKSVKLIKNMFKWLQPKLIKCNKVKESSNFSWNHSNYFVISCYRQIFIEELEQSREFYLSQNRLLKLLFAMYNLLAANSEIVCYFIIVLNNMVSASVISLVLPILVFLWAMLSVPRPTKRFWMTAIIYTEVWIHLKWMSNSRTYEKGILYYIFIQKSAIYFHMDVNIAWPSTGKLCYVVRTGPKSSCEFVEFVEGFFTHRFFQILHSRSIMKHIHIYSFRYRTFSTVQECTEFQHRTSWMREKKRNCPAL